MPKPFDQCQVDQGKTLKDALSALERGATGMALATDGQGRLVGTLTDGDIRRALLKGATLQDGLAAFMNRRFTSVGPEVGRVEILDLMQARVIQQIPIVDGNSRLLGLHLMHEILGGTEHPNWAVVMAGGRGARLHPITEQIPKPMIRVAGRPILERIVLQLVGGGIRRIFLAINHLGPVIESHFQDGSRFGCRIEYLREGRPLGTGGALSLLPETPSHPILVMNGDLVTHVDVAAFLASHDPKSRQATVAVSPYLHQIPYGCVQLDGSRVVSLEEKPCLVRQVNAGIYLLNPELLSRIPRDEEFALPALLEGCIARGETVQAYELEADWIDVGRFDQLRQAREGKA